ncbi:hypothetical protein D3272_25590 [Lichenibacterium ramalinae]|uniref:Uncharacterized protein n=1 Tax=Lichenibacterium ramalinae TaxID=2316527 RepID=A0A4V1RHX0_9HYPH|nr:hypothetical protein D3272_25590 [Lichenibacterium ramalinae]
MGDGEGPRPHVVDQTLWDRAKADQAVLDALAIPAGGGSTFRSKQRPRHPGSGLTRCGVGGERHDGDGAGADR